VWYGAAWILAFHPFSLQVIATSLPPEEIEGIRRMFIEMDDDGSGTISFEELRQGELLALEMRMGGGGVHPVDQNKLVL